MRFVALALGLVGISGTLLMGTAVAATADLRRDIEAKLVETQRKAAPDLNVGAATCPAALSKAVAKATPGVHRCVVLVEGVKVPYDVTLRTSSAVKGGSYTLRNAKAVIDTKKLATIAATVVDDPSKVKITCGTGRVVVADPGTIISCTVVDGAATDTLKFQVKDLTGLVAFVP
jgi:hypothetical protein